MKNENVTRILIDIKDLKLSETNIQKELPLVSISKHLCGSATDLTLRCLNAVPKLSTGIVIALCCHQVCDYDTYINVEYLETCGIDKGGFELMKQYSSWAICNWKDGEHWSKISVAERVNFGITIKRVLDIGRVLYLQKNGYQNTELVNYCGIKSSLENTALIATRDS